MFPKFEVCKNGQHKFVCVSSFHKNRAVRARIEFLIRFAKSLIHEKVTAYTVICKIQPIVKIDYSVFYNFKQVNKKLDPVSMG
jgi:hypothetical protein